MTHPRHGSSPFLWLLALLVPLPLHATPLDFIPVGDPLEDELRVLEVAGGTGTLPHFGMRPWQIAELPDFAERPSDPALALTLARLRRGLGRDREPGAIAGSTPRLVQLARGDDQRFEISVGLEGRGITSRERNPSVASGTGAHWRFGAQNGRWVAHSHVMMANVTQGPRFAESIFPGGDVVLHSEDATLGYLADSSSWSAQMGRTRWHWGPGYEGSLLLSRTSVSLDGIGARFRIAPLRADAMVLSATLAASAGERLAAHRLEWQPLDPLRIGVGEAVRYRSSAPEPLYVIGLLPYTLVQSLLHRDEPDSFTVLRNNILFGFDVAWRVAPGTRVYGDLLIDDLRTDLSNAVDKLGWQVGAEGVGSIRAQRLSWGVECTRLTRFVYTSFFGRAFVAQGVPLGFPTGPDARRVTARGTWDPGPSWQVFARAARTDAGESGIDVPYVPGSPSVPTGTFAGVVERITEGEVGLRWWPASGVDVAVSGGIERIEDAGHVPSERRNDARASLSLRLIR